ncbi:hypothetical protein NDU88_001305 [Pleurodeles waltl]|uniref:Uncharacterized protein n=1 Tax=Pleurodeles waltl TaxID=8319 RepID=A0AAV7SZZ1_PLEWA|nr:hypothetical protein NDU88_001305 [Pleurodeles waltl]
MYLPGTRYLDPVACQEDTVTVWFQQQRAERRRSTARLAGSRKGARAAILGTHYSGAAATALPCLRGQEEGPTAPDHPYALPAHLFSGAAGERETRVRKRGGEPFTSASGGRERRWERGGGRERMADDSRDEKGEREFTGSSKNI